MKHKGKNRSLSTILEMKNKAKQSRGKFKRYQVVLELDQIAIHPDFQGLGLSKALIVESLKDVENELLAKNQKIKSVLVTTGGNNFAKKIYEDLFNAQEVAIISDLYSAPEVYLKANREGLVFLDARII
ncbi:GNAT family N-acetyltransferase [Acinetobacter silvestris]|uniref:GNAT family N-acetyltransferase n=1 Tax=Acinetobacter silvestris TaxID=1977882 RepID=UPI002074AFD6|nr:N-acetyltransferase [Acinetobacter silvestris]